MRMLLEHFQNQYFSFLEEYAVSIGKSSHEHEIRIDSSSFSRRLREL